MRVLRYVCLLAIGASAALPAAAQFQKKEDAVANLAVVVKANNPETLKTAFGTVGGSCKACHDECRN